MDFQSLFSRLLSSGRLSHGYLFYGPDRAAAKVIALSLGCLLEKGEWRSPSGALTDCFELSSSGRRVIGIDDARFIRRFLFIRPLISRRRLAVIHDAEYLTPEAQHALLKISEDAPLSSLIILIAGNREALLPTIVSRFQSIFFSAAASVSPYSAADLALAKKFISAVPVVRRSLIKNIVDKERRSAAKIQFISDSPADQYDFILPFLEALSFILYSSLFAVPAGSLRSHRAAAVRRVLSLSADLHEFELNRRLALEALAVALERLPVV